MDPGEIAAARIPAVLDLGYLYLVVLLKRDSKVNEKRTPFRDELRPCIFFSAPRSVIGFLLPKR